MVYRLSSDIFVGKQINAAELFQLIIDGKVENNTEFFFGA